MKIGTFILNKNEQRVVVLVVLALLVGAFIRYSRAVNWNDRPHQSGDAQVTATPLPSPENDESSDQE